MLEIKNMGIFAETVEHALRINRVRGTRDTRDRWASAIVKAAALLKSADLTFFEFDRETSSLVLLSPRSNKAYVTGDTCECKAFVDHQQPCYHRALARLLKRYFENVEKPRPVPTVIYPIAGADKPRVLACENTSCGWRGIEHELLSPVRHVAVCPKCESPEIYETEAVAVMTVGGIAK